MRQKISLQSGFSTVIALLLTAFLITLSASILNLFMTEYRISNALYSGISSYAGAEGMLEYALLKIKNHREGFEDAVQLNEYDTHLMAKDPTAPDVKKDPLGTYRIEASGTDFSGTLLPGETEIIPLFIDSGEIIQTLSKHPKSPKPITKVSKFSLDGDTAFGWNIIGNDPSGKTFGLAGSGGISKDVSETSAGQTRKFDDSSQKMIYGSDTVSSFLSKENPYLMITNYSEFPLKYHLVATSPFAFPRSQIIAGAKIGDLEQTIRLQDNKSKQFEILKYSIFQ